MGYKRGGGPWGLLGVRDLGPIWGPCCLGPMGPIYLFGTHLGPHFIWGPFGPYFGPRCYPLLGGLLVYLGLLGDCVGSQASVK